MPLNETGRSRLDQHFVDTAHAFNQTPRDPSAGQHFSATPSVAQRIYEKVVEHGDDFLKMVNVYPRSEVKGQKLGMSLTKRVGSNTDTSNGNKRKPTRLNSLDSKGYELFKNNFDVAIGYEDIDTWAKFSDFEDRYMNLVRRSIADDWLQCGWTGTHYSKDSDIETYPLLEDFNIGWLQLLREYNAGSQHFSATTDAPLLLGGSTAKNLDVLVHMAKEMLPIYHRNRKDLVAIIGGDILSSQEETYYENNGDTPTEKALLSGRITKAYGSLPSIYAPFFPGDSVMVTPLKNLSIYYQDTSVRRTQRDMPDIDEVQDFNSLNLGYAVENEEMSAFIEGITLS